MGLARDLVGLALELRSQGRTEGFSIASGEEFLEVPEEALAVICIKEARNRDPSDILRMYLQALAVHQSESASRYVLAEFVVCTLHEPLESQTRQGTSCATCF